MSAAAVHLAMSLIGPNYVFERQLGIGGNGVVILARDRSLDRLVAVKTILTTSADGPAQARLRREGRVLAALGHPHILEVYRLIEDGAAIALVTEFVSGGDLDGALKKYSLPGSTLVRVLCQVATALDAAHSVGIVHRDIKPANILLDAHDRAVVADFGLARLRGEFRTEDGLASGTPLYMSPEQIDNPDVERPSMDIYSFAIMVYRVVCGRSPFVASTLAELIAAHRESIPDWPGAVRPGIPEPVSEVLLAALAKDPDRRAPLAAIAAVLGAVDDSTWDALLPAVVVPQAPTDSPARVAATEQRAESGPQTEAESDDTAQHDATQHDECATARAVAPGRETGSTEPIEPTVYELVTSPSPPRWRRRLLACAAGLVIGILVGAAVLTFVL